VPGYGEGYREDKAIVTALHPRQAGLLMGIPDHEIKGDISPRKWCSSLRSKYGNDCIQIVDYLVGQSAI
jgi:hypothetical protein